MQIDILSSNTLKLTLSRLDMFDLDIKYESLSGKNPETKRLLAHVLKTIRLDRMGGDIGFDFTCERIFVEAFPRPDGGCMLYVSSLESGGVKKKRSSAGTGVTAAYKAGSRAKTLSTDVFIYETENPKELGVVCRGLCLHAQPLDSSLYLRDKTYRLIISGESMGSAERIIREYAEPKSGERELYFTKEHYRSIIEENAAGRLAELL